MGILAGLLTVFLVVDFVDRARAYTGEGWVWDVVELYGCKALVATQQLGPAALLLAAGTSVSALRKRGEVTAILALGFGPAALLPPGGGGGAAWRWHRGFDEFVVGHASRRVDEITTQRFNRWGDWRLFYTPKQWFRQSDRIFYLRAARGGGLPGRHHPDAHPGVRAGASGWTPRACSTPAARGGGWWA